MGALALVFLEGGAAPAGKEAMAAYVGLSVVQAAFRKIGKPREAEALLKEARAAAEQGAAREAQLAYEIEALRGEAMAAAREASEASERREHSNGWDDAW